MKEGKNPPFSFYFARSGSGWFVSNDTGRGILLTEGEFKSFSRGGALKPALRKALEAGNFLRERLDLEKVSVEMRERFLGGWTGPRVHIVSVTARCNSSCRYCAPLSPLASAKNDMSAETAARTVDFIFGIKAPTLLIEFQGGEPLLNFEAVKRIVRLAGRRAEKEGREIHFSIVTNLTLMDEGKLAFLSANRVTVCTSLDGPAALHDRVRKLPGGGAHALVKKWLGRLMEEKAKTPDFETPSAICTVTRFSLDKPREIVDEFLRLGLYRVQLGPLDPFGLAAVNSSELSYSAEEFANFYSKALDYMFELNSGGIPVYEKGARAFAARLLGGGNPGYYNLDLALRLAYNWDGSIYGSDEARMFSNSGDDFFRLGSVHADSFPGLLRSPLARALLLSCFQGISDVSCARCPLNLYCRVPPAYNYAAQGSFWGNKAASGRCALFKRIFGDLLERMRLRENREIFANMVKFPA